MHQSLVNSHGSGHEDLSHTGVSANWGRTTNAEDETEFACGDQVEPWSAPGEVGAVVKVLREPHENRYIVLQGAAKHVYYASQLRPVASAITEPEVITLPELRATLSALQIQHPGATTLYSLNAGAIDFVPYQFRRICPLFK